MCLPMSRTSFPCQMNASGQPMAVLQQDALKQWIQSSTSFRLDPLVPWIKLLLFFLMLNFNGSFQWIRGVTNFGDQSTSAKCLEKIIFGCTLVDQQAMVSFHDCGMVVLSDIIQGCEIVFFLLNMLVTPLSPHIVQRTYIATSDADMRIVMGAMLLAPFIAQTPGIIMGLTKTLGWADGIQWDVKGEAAGCRKPVELTSMEHQKRLPTQHLTSASHLLVWTKKA